jgi:hypothetical protein
MLSVFHESGLAFRSELRDGVYHMEARFEETGPGATGSASSSSGTSLEP